MKEFYIDGYLKQNLDTAKRVVKKDWDMVFLYDGMEGSGKSVKAMQDAYYCDPTLCLDRITFTADEFKKAIIGAEKYQAVIYDEAYTGLSSRQAMSKINTSLIKMLAEIRQKNLFIFVVMPTFFDLDKYVAIWRSRALIHVYNKEAFERGYFAFFNSDRKKKLYVLGKKFYSYSATKSNFHGRFINYYPVDEKEYRSRKKKALSWKIFEQQDKEDFDKWQKDTFNRFMEMDIRMKNIDKVKFLGISEPTYYQWVKSYSNMRIDSNLSNSLVNGVDSKTKQGVVDG